MNNETQDIQNLINVLENELRSATNMPLTGKQLVDAASCLDILTEMKNSLPDSLRRANHIIEEAGNINRDAQQKAADVIESARVQGDEILRDADMQAHQIASEHEITQRAHMQADEILEDAARHANNMVARAETHSNQVHEAMMNYIDETLSGLHETLVQHMRVIGNEIDSMRENREQLMHAAPESFHAAPDGYAERGPAPGDDMLG